MPEVVWPSSSEVHAAVAQRIRRLLDEHGGLIADFGRRTMSVGHGVLSDDPHSFTAVVIPGACLTAGADWHAALWPTAAAECMMAAADLFGTEFARAANGQAANLQPAQPIDAITAYLQAAAKSGPLGSLMAQLGARTATDSAEIIDLLGQFGRCLAV